MILGAAFCPHPPILIPEVASGAAPELADLLAACDAAVAALLSVGADLVVVLGAGEGTAGSAAIAGRGIGTLSGYGAPVTASLGPDDGADPAALPLSLTVGGWLLARQPRRPPTRAVTVSAADPEGAARAVLASSDGVATALLVMGDGSARGSERSPGYLDDRAAPFDDALGTALASGDPAVLAHLDRRLGDEVLAAGVPALVAAGIALAGTSWVGQVTYAGAPFGVQYLVATWATPSTGPATPSTGPATP